MKPFIITLLAFAALCFAPPEAFAHKPSDSYLRLSTDGQVIHGEWDIALRDLDISVGLDDNHDAKITWGEVKAKQQAIEQYAAAHLQLSAGKLPCPLQFKDLLINAHSDGHYVVLRFDAACGVTVDALTIDDSFLYDMDAQHKNLIALRNGQFVQGAILSADQRKVTLSTHAPGIWKQLRDFTRQGMVHIWLGYDHLLFLIALLLPAAWVYRSGKLRMDMPFKTVFWEVFTFISAFTLAHAITLALAMFDVIHVPSRLTESLIALTIVVSCINNLLPFLKQRLWLLTFGFGLIHGMGFATTLSELGLSGAARWTALIGFNCGVELGQLVVVAILLPIFYTIREHKAYRVLVVQGGSLLIMAVSLIWFVQRAFAIVLIPLFLY
jgi:hypothetical protein